MLQVSATSVMVLAALTLGCAPFVRRSELDYRTVRADPSRDTERARSENQKAIKLLNKGKAQRAEAALQQALISDVDYGPAHNNLGKLYFSQGKLYLAAWEFAYANRLMPHRPECQNNLGLVYESAGKLDEAIACYAQAYEVDPKNADFMGNLARAKYRRGDNDPQLVGLLNDLQFYDDRADWVHWAGEQLALGRVGAKPPGSSRETLPDQPLPLPRPPEEPIDPPPQDPAGPELRIIEEDSQPPETLPAPDGPFERSANRQPLDPET